MPRLGVRAILAVLPDVMMEQTRDEIFRVYITDALKVIGHIEQRYYTLANPDKIDKRTGDEIALEVIESAGLRFDNGSA